MMNKKGEIGLGVIVITFITILVGVIFFQVIAQEAGSSTTLDTLVNTSMGLVTNETTVYLEDYRNIASPVIVASNGSDVNELAAGNYTLTNNAINPTTGSLSVSILPEADGLYSGKQWNISGTAQPVTYIAESGARAVAGLIAIFFALAVLLVALIPTLREKFM
jgi:hypothetical protein